MMDTSFIFRGIALLLFLAILFIWFWEHRKTEQKKPGVRFAYTLSYRTFSKLALRIIYLMTAMQLLGLPILPIRHGLFMLQLVGIILTFVGALVAITARVELGSNWSMAWDYQVKKEHSLITTGIYHYIRHPIYTGMSIFIIGCELVVGSYLFIPMAVVLFGGSYVQARREEAILQVHFGKGYQAYKKQSKMLLPYIL